jgi:hypothetical protein
MEPKKRMKASLPPHYLAVQTVGVFALALGVLILFSNLRPVVTGIAPWLGIPWIAWTVFGLGVFIIFINGARLIAHTRRIKQNA